ncbi:hypothetical protein SDC9_132205 [bioreactor metagenome]|uniref:Uncharacterized protein n=1 Tax=bioreactor metagenome TaxID=1076179 RepID=A0A645D7U4_9ZZZZ
MRYTDAKMRSYYLTLPPKVRARLMNTKVEFASLGELMMVGEHFRNELDPEERHPPS